MSSLSLVLPAEATRHTPLPPLPSIVSDGASPAPDLLQQGSVLGGYVGGCDQLVWRALGPTVEVLGSSTGTRVAAWTFGAVFRSTTAKVLSACGVGGCSGAITHIVCGVDRGPEASPRGLLAVLSLASSKIVRAFTFPHPVVSVCVVRGGDAWVDDGTLHPSLRPCSPILVLATEQPSLHLLDLALDIAGDSVSSDELSPGSLVGLPPLPPNTAAPPPSFLQHRISALRERLHFGATLLEGSVSGGRFFLLGPSDSVLCQLSAAAVRVTALLYIPQLASLAIGYNFGAFQLYNLYTLAIDCASPYEEGVPGVMSFAYQEPENDPRNCVYLWLCRSVDPLSLQDSEPPCDAGAVCTLYSMTYEKREWIEGHGLWYQGLTAIAPRFEFEADGSPCPVQGRGGGEGDPRATVLFTSHTVTRPSPPATPPPLAHCPPSMLLGGPEDEGTSTVSDLSLCLFGWYSRSVDDLGRETTQHFVGLFDINQWYQAQMPATAQLFAGRLCPYMSFHRLDRVPCGPHERVLAAAPLTTTCITRHMAPTGTSDRDWYPAALSYGVGVLSSSGCAWYRCRSAPQWCLRWLLAQGPAAVLLCPQEALLRCAFAGILPLSGAAVGDTDSASPRTGPKDERSDRETVLDVCLSQQLLSVLNDCVSEFSDGKFSSVGCTLPSLLHWAWARVTRTKADNDTLLSLLFSGGDAQLTPEQLQRLHHNLTVLGTLRAVLSLCAHHTPETTRHAGGGVGEVGACATVVSLLQQHLTVTLWFQHCQLLPEVDPSLAMDDSNAVPYPAVPLAQIYRNKRREIGALNARLEGSELLLIDQLMAELLCAAGGIVDGWPGAVYPPPSLQALLNIYLLPDPPLPLKHRIVQYLFIDLSSILTDGFSTAVEYLIKFPASAKLSPSIIKLTQAFWLLDQQDYQSAVDLFLDPLVVRTDITAEQHRRILRALLCQDQAGLALSYLEGRAPPHQSPEDAQLQLSVLLACGRVREAFHYQRQHGTSNSQQQLLQHLLQGCEHYGRLGDVLQLPLLPSEEAALLQHLKNSDHPHAQDVYTIYCLRNARYSSIAREMPSVAGGLEAHNARSALLRSYSTHFPATTAPQHAALLSRRSEYCAPKPLSARIRQAAISPNNSRVTDYNRHLTQLSEAPSQQTFTPFRSSTQRRRKLDDVDLSKSQCSVLFPSRLLDLTSTGGQRAPGDRLSMLASTTSVDKRLLSLRDVSSHITALLCSPPVTHRLSSRLSFSGAIPALGDLSAPPTPQSILKVRSLLQRPSSPCSSVGDLTVPAPRLLTPRQVTLVKLSDEDSPGAAASCLTPKQLRFALPTPPLLDASNDATLSGDSAFSNVKPAPFVISRDVADGTDSDEHSDLDVQLEPYIHRTGKHESTPSSTAAAQALYEEQESWEMLSESQLRLNVTSSHHEVEAVATSGGCAAAVEAVAAAPSFSGVLQRLSEHDNRSEAAALSAIRDLQTPPADDDDAVSDTNEQFYSFDSEDQEQQQDVEEQQQEEELEGQVHHVEEDVAHHRAAERILQGRVVDEEEQVVETVVQVEEQEVFEGDDEHAEKVLTEEMMEVQEVHHLEFEDEPNISILEQSKDARTRADPIKSEAKYLAAQKNRPEKLTRSSKRKRDVILVEEQSSQDAFELDEEKRGDDHSRILCSTEEQDSQDASFVTSADKGLELNEISAEEVAECLHEKVLCETELRFSDSSEENIVKKQLDRADKRNTANVKKTTTHTTTGTVKEVLPLLHFSDSDEEQASEDRAKKSRIIKSSIDSVDMTTTTTCSRIATKEKEVLPHFDFSDSEEDNVPEKKLNSKSIVNSSTSSLKLSGKRMAPKESLPVLQFSDSEEELQVDEPAEMSSEDLHQSHKTGPGNVKCRETLSTLNLSSSEEEEEDQAVQPIETRLKEEPSAEEVSRDNERMESDVDSLHVEPTAAAERSIRDEIVGEIIISEQMEATTTTGKSSSIKQTLQELDRLEQVKATTAGEKSSTSNEIVKEMSCSENVESTKICEKSLTCHKTIEEQQVSNIDKTADLHKDASSNVANVLVVSSSCCTINNTNNVRVEESTPTKIMETSLNSSLKRRSLKPLAILDTPSKPYPHALELLRASITLDANEPSKIPVDRRRGKSEDRIIRGTPTKARSSFGGKLELSMMTKEAGTPISGVARIRAMSEEPSSGRRDTPAKVATRGRRLSGISMSNKVERPQKLADIVTPVTPLRRSSRRLGGDSPIIARDVGVKGEILQTSSRLGHDASLLHKIEEDDCEESNLWPNVDASVASQGRRVENEATTTIKLEEREKTATEMVESETDGLESDSSMGLPETMSPSRRGRRSSLGGVTEVSSPSTPLRRSSRRSVTPSKFGTPVLDPVLEENTPKKARTPFRSAIKDLLDEDVSVTPKRTVDAPVELITPSSGARRGRRNSVQPDSLTPSQCSVADANVVSTPTPGRRTRRKSITSLEPLHVIEEISEVEEVSSTDVSPSSSGKSLRKTKRLSIAPELPPIMEDLELPKTETPVKGRWSRQSSPASEERKVESDATSSQTLLKSATKKAAQQIVPSRTPVNGIPLKTDSTEMDEATVATVPGRGRRRSSMASSFGAASTRSPRLRKSIGCMRVTSSLDTPSSDESPRRRSTRPSPALSSSVVYQTAKVYSSDDDDDEEDDEKNEQESPYLPSLTEGQSEDEQVFDEEGESHPRGTKLRPLKKASSKKEATGGNEGPRRRLSHASVTSSTGRKSVGLKRGRESMKITELLEEEGEDSERRTKRPRRGHSAAGGRGDE